jgi:protein TonB
MNIHKYVIPASLAAAVHVALLTLAPGPTSILIEVPLAASPLPPIPKTPDDPIAQPPEDRPVSVEPVKPLLGKPAPPSIDDVPPTKLPADAFTMQVDNRPRPIDYNLRELPTTIGSEMGVPGGIDPSAVNFINAGMLDGVPRAKVQIPPEYPYAKKQTGESGSVTVEFDVDTSGRVIRAEAMSYTDREFVEPALRAVRKWRFEPGRRDGQAVPFRMTIPIEFGIEGT